MRKLINSVFRTPAYSRTGVAFEMPNQARLTVRSHLEELSGVQHWFRTLILRMSVDMPWIDDQFDQLNLALAEGFTNAVRHAHANLPEATPIDIELTVSSQELEIRIFDRGEPFDPNSLIEPKPGALREGGYGWFLLRRLADRVSYDCVQDRLNCLSIVKTSKNM